MTPALTTAKTKMSRQCGVAEELPLTVPILLLDPNLLLPPPTLAHAAKATLC